MEATSTKIILIGNYIPDRQESMERFTVMLHDEFSANGVDSEIWRPVALFGAKFKNTNAGVGKWLGYIDKWILFPLVLRYRVLFKNKKVSNIRYHICDHSNSPYLGHLPADKTVITCHDVIAIRGGLGYTDYYQPASAFGKILQKWILGNLKRAKQIACVSQYTLDQLIALVPGSYTPDKDWQVILNTFNGDFRPIPPAETAALLAEAGLKPDTKYLLHVGSNLQRKNREMLLKMLVDLGDNWDGYICYSGKPIDEKLTQKVKELNMEHRVIQVIKPRHEVLRALYNGCYAFIFPSFAEGFGWPVIEAQACGAPVIASNLQPMPEVSGGAAIHANPADSQDFANALLLLKDTALRSNLIKAGFKNCERFEKMKITQQYLSMHGLNHN